MKRVVIAGLLGGVALFLWGSVVHMLSGISETGIKVIPNEQAVLDAMTASIKEPGLYLFPGGGLTSGATKEQRAAAMEEIDKRAKTGPNGILVIHPNGGGGLTAGRLIIEFALNVVQAFLLVGLVAWVAPNKSYLSRASLVTLAGVFGSLATNVQYWNWYGFPADYTVVYILVEIVGFVVVGLVAAAIVKGESRAMAP